jgi:hypothetical protein
VPDSVDDVHVVLVVHVISLYIDNMIFTNTCSCSSSTLVPIHSMYIYCALPITVQVAVITYVVLFLMNRILKVHMYEIL